MENFVKLSALPNFKIIPLLKMFRIKITPKYLQVSRMHLENGKQQKCKLEYFFFSFCFVQFLPFAWRKNKTKFREINKIKQKKMMICVKWYDIFFSQKSVTVFFLLWNVRFRLCGVFIYFVNANPSKNIDTKL